MSARQIIVVVSAILWGTGCKHVVQGYPGPRRSPQEVATVAGGWFNLLAYDGHGTRCAECTLELLPGEHTLMLEYEGRASVVISDATTVYLGMGRIVQIYPLGRQHWSGYMQSVPRKVTLTVEANHIYRLRPIFFLTPTGTWDKKGHEEQIMDFAVRVVVDRPGIRYPQSLMRVGAFTLGPEPACGERGRICD